MAKPDIRTAAKLTWDEYKDKSIEQALPSIYAQATEASQKFTGWYWRSIKTKRWTSLAIRFGTFLLLAAGTLFPILSGLWLEPIDKLRLTQSGVCALLLAGLFQIADRVFGWSSGWLRYITTATAMENLSQQFELDWAGYILGKNGHVLDADVKPLFDLAAGLQESLMKLQVEETDKWVTEFKTGGALLGDLIKSQRESGDKAADAASAAFAAQKAAADARSRQAGSVELTLFHQGEVQPVTILFDATDRVDFTGTVWSRLNVAPGLHTIGVATTSVPPFNVTKIVDVPSGGIARIEIALSV
ncbi:hypothetical protein AAKU55_003194 [Oxalobacteraceae bacterium GrIS 1.11]